MLVEVRKGACRYFDTKWKEFIFRPVIVVIGVAASESKFSPLLPLFRVVLIGVDQ